MCAVATASPTPPIEPVRLPEPQTRGYIINLIRSLSPSWLELEIRRAAEAGFNLILFPAYNNGWTLFPSQAVRAYGMGAINPLFRKWDPLAVVTSLARDAGLTVWTYIRPFNFHPRYSVAEHRLLKKHPEWRQRAHPDYQSQETRRHEQWHACPINTTYRRYVADLMAEMVSAYPVDGIVINYDSLDMNGGALRGSPYCFCGFCRENYYEEFHTDILSDAAGRNLERFRHWQLARVQEHFSYLRHRMIRSRRTLRVVCRAKPTWRERADYPGPPMENRALLMDWPSQLASGAIEELAIDPDGEPCGPTVGARLAADYAYLGDKVLFLPIFSINQPQDLRWPLQAIGRFPAPGFLVEFQNSPTDEEARLIREVYFPDPAPLPESDPVRTAAFLLSRVRQLHEDQPIIYDLLYDFLRLLARHLPMPNDFNSLAVIEQNLHGLEQFIRRGRLGKIRLSERTMRDLGLARRFIRMACMDVRT